jgi:starch synthase
MYSLAYGTVPLVTQVGGLHDTVRDADAPATAAEGTGITFAPNAHAFRDGLRRALKLFSDKPRYAAVQARGMATDNSWDKAAQSYEYLYTEML